jgi:hypothetical protein
VVEATHPAMNVLRVVHKDAQYIRTSKVLLPEDVWKTRVQR